MQIGQKKNVLFLGIILNIKRFLQVESKTYPPPFLPKLAETQNFWIWQKNENIESPTLSYVRKIDLPNVINWTPSPLIEPLTDKVIEAPSTPENDITKEAVRMIVIRRKKMKRHKLKKLRKRLKFLRAKVSIFILFTKATQILYAKIRNYIFFAYFIEYLLENFIFKYSLTKVVFQKNY